MKAIPSKRFGGAEMLRYEEVEKPIPADGEILVKVRAASVGSRQRQLDIAKTVNRAAIRNSSISSS